MSSKESPTQHYLISAFNMAEGFDLAGFKADYTAKLLAESNSELFYLLGEHQYLIVFNYGVVVFANLSDADMSKTISLLHNYSRDELESKIRDDVEVVVQPDAAMQFAFDRVMLPEVYEDVFKVIMLAAAHNVALDFYGKTAESLLHEVKKFTLELERDGKLHISQRNMLRFIGRTLNSKNNIIENLYIFDEPEIVWENEYLDKINKGLGRFFNLRERFREIEYTFKVIEDNLSIFKELHMHRESSRLEWIIIVLILIEVFDLIFSKLF